MIKKYRVYIWIILVLAILAGFLYLTDKPGTLKVDGRIFTVTDTSSVTKIRLGDGRSSISLERQGNGWTVNGGFNARTRAVKTILGVISGIEISSPVSKSMLDVVNQSFQKYALSISVESSGDVVKAYRISENDSLRIGSFAMLSGDNIPYVVRLMSYDGRLSKLFPVDPQFWRDKTLFSYRPADILTIEIVYALHPENSFTYQFFGPGELKIKSLNTHQFINIDKTKARDYLQNFSAVPFRLMDPERSGRLYDSLTTLKPYCEIRVKNTENQKKVIKMYQIQDQKKPGNFDVNFMYALVQDDKVPVVVKYIDLDPIMRKFSDFAQK